MYYGIKFIFLIGFKFQFTECAKSIQNTQVEITTYRYDHDETYRLSTMMRTGYRPPNHSYSTRFYNVRKTVCYDPKTFSFSMGDLNFECPIHDGSANLKINNTHELICPTYCEVCQETHICSKGRSLSGIIYTPDGRKKDFISFHYGTLDREKEREINWFILICYIFLFTLFTNIVAFVFTD